MNKNNKSVVDLASDDENIVDIPKRKTRISNNNGKTESIDTSVEVIENIDDEVMDATPSKTKRMKKKRIRSDSPDIIDTSNDNGSLLSYFSSSAPSSAVVAGGVKNNGDEHNKERRRIKNNGKSDAIHAQQPQRSSSSQSRARASDKQLISSSLSSSTDMYGISNNDDITPEEMERIYGLNIPDTKRQKHSEASSLRKEQDEEFEIAQAIDQSKELHEKQMQEELKRKATMEEQEKKLIQESEEEMIKRLKESLPNEPSNEKDGIMIIIRLPSMKLKRRFPSDTSKVKHLFSFVELNEPKCRGTSYSLRIPPILSSSSQTSTISSSQITTNESQASNEETKVAKQNGEDGVSLTVMDSATILKSNDPDIRDVPLSSLEKQLKGSVLQVLFPF